MANVNVKKMSLLGLISSKTSFQVPRYQRGYAWEDENFSEFWSDLKKSFERKVEHFFGVVIFYQKDGFKNRRVVEVIDGQQRLSTTFILLRCILEKLDNIGAPDAKINALYNKFFLPKKGSTDFKITLGEIDRVFFLKSILRSPKSSFPKEEVVIDSHKRIAAADKFFTQKINEYLQGRKDKTKALYDLLKDLEKFLVVVVLEVPSDDEAFTIFETINSRGVELSVSDLLKNYIFSILDKNTESSRPFNDVRNKWEKMEEQLQKKGVELSQFIRHYWLSKYNKVVEKELYRAIKKKFSGRSKGVLRFADSLFREQEAYLNCLDAVEGKKISKVGARALKDINDLKLKQCYPLLLSLMAKNYPRKSTDMILRKIVSLNVRRGLMGINPNKLETLFADTALEVRRKRPQDSLARFNKNIGENWVKDNDLKSSLIDKQISPQLARFVLRQLESSKHQYKEDKVPKKQTLEHILPQNPKLKEWGIDQETLDAYVGRLGNITLVGREINSEMRNSRFSIKRKALKNTQYAISQEIRRKNKNWGTRQIDRRTKAIADFICKEWHL